MNNLRRFTGAVAALAIVFFARHADAADAPAIPITVAVTAADATAQVFYAQDLGFFKAAGLDVKIIVLPVTTPAIASGAADIGSATIGTGVAARSHGVNVQFIAAGGLYLAATPTAQLMVANGSPIKTAADFNDKTIAEASLADLPYWATKTWLDQNGGSSAKVKFIELGLLEMVAAVREKRIDGAVLFEPFVTAAGSDVRALAPVVNSVGKRFLSTGWLANESWLATHADAAKRFTAVMKQTAEWANAHQKESADILVRNSKIPPEVMAKIVRVTYATSINIAELQPPIDDAQKYGGFPRTVTAAEMVWIPK